MPTQELLDVINREDYYKGLSYREPIEYTKSVKHGDEKEFHFLVESQRSYNKYQDT